MKYAVVIFLLLSAACTKNKPAANKPTEDLLVTLEKQIKTSPSYENYIKYGVELGKRGHHLGSLEAYEKAAELNPKAPLAWNNICAELNALHRYAEAASNCEIAISSEPNFELAKNNLAYSQQKVAELTAKYSDNKRKLMKSKNPQELIDLGMGLYSLNDHTAAIEAWSKVSKEAKLFATAQNNIASSYIVLNQFPLAEKAISQALALEPNNQLFTNNKKWLERKSKGL